MSLRLLNNFEPGFKCQLNSMAMQQLIKILKDKD